MTKALEIEAGDRVVLCAVPSLGIDAGEEAQVVEISVTSTIGDDEPPVPKYRIRRMITDGWASFDTLTGDCIASILKPYRRRA